MSSYDVYQGPGAETAEPTAPSGTPEAAQEWRVLVEYSNEGERKPPTVVDELGPVYVSREVALKAAERVAFDHQPPDPLSPRGRTVYERTDGFLTVVEGAMSTFHFRTHVVRLVGRAER
ncbi:hypothetical protein [Nocardioides lijunqiniae]|uniref:hypothetical protein n=1 Tax=Nocardioides lijunqiniae TaxID=2760832 RepID=UPI001878EE37|nr:hypothetical protein [Nocardioides lijunqiniae]